MMTKCCDRHTVISTHKPWRSITMFVLGFVLAGGAIGCSTEARYKIKTIVFTGVPPLHEEQQQEIEPDLAQAEKAEQMARQEQFRAALISPYWQHGPYAAGECERCHNLRQSKSFLGSRTAADQQPPSAASTSAPSRLIMPPQQLCITCHAQHGVAYARSQGLKQHLPVSAGLCTGCHNPHQSLRQYMLLGADNRELCTRCHGANRLSESHTADPAKDCIDCHNAHVGLTSSLLRSDAAELKLLYDGRADE
jgi:predicted CXXCH cytochrome family protein